MRKHGSFIGLGIAALLVAGTVVAQEGRMPRGPGGPGSESGPRSVGHGGPGGRSRERGGSPMGVRGGGRHGDGGEALIQRVLASPELAKELGLNEEQVAAIKEGLYGIRKQSVELRAQLELAGMKQAKLMTAEELDEKALMKAVEETGRIHTEMAKLKVKGLLLVREHVSPEQVKAMRERFHERMKSHRDRWEARGGGPRERHGDRAMPPPETHDGGQPPPEEMP